MNFISNEKISSQKNNLRFLSLNNIIVFDNFNFTYFLRTYLFYIFLIIVSFLYTTPSISFLDEEIDNLYSVLGVRGKIEFGGLKYGFGDSYDYQKRKSPQLTHSIKIIKEAAYEGDPYAQWIIGRLHDVLIRDVVDGFEDPRKTAIVWYELSAAQGFHDSEFDLGRLYDIGRGMLECNKKEAERLISLAAVGGNPRAQNWFGMVYAKKYDEKMRWLRKAADQGYAKACANIGYMLEMNGESVEARKQYRQSLTLLGERDQDLREEVQERLHALEPFCILQ